MRKTETIMRFYFFNLIKNFCRLYMIHNNNIIIIITKTLMMNNKTNLN